MKSDSTKIKICGITNLADAKFALEKGADFVGLIFAKRSPRAVSIDEANRIVSELPSDAKVVGVFVDESAEFIKSATSRCNLFAVQLHGNQDNSFALNLRNHIGAEIWRAVWIESKEQVESALLLQADVLVADSRMRNIVGGTGIECNWNLASLVATRRKTILAGAIGCQNAREAVESVKPWGLDANSRLEISPRKKDHLKIDEFIRKIRR